MRGIDSRDLLCCFEQGAGRAPLEKGLLLLRFAWPEADEEQLRALPLAERDRLLLALRRATFGPRLELTAQCPRCGAELETPLDLDRLLAAPAPADPLAELPLELEGRSLRLRRPSSADLAAVLDAPPADAFQLLAERTISPPAAGRPFGAAELEAIAAAWDAADPLAEVRLALDCAVCGQAFEELFDIVAAFSAELEAQARRLLLDIHRLAAAYGWSEGEILALGPQRRRLYVEMVS